MNRKWALGLGIPLVVIALLVVGGYAWVRSPVDTEGYSDPVSADATEQNTALTAALLAGGLDDAFVDVSREQAYVAYELPDDSTTSPTDWQWFVFGAAADTVQGADRLVVVQYDDERPVLSWSVPMETLQAFADGDTGAAAFEADIDKRTY